MRETSIITIKITIKIAIITIRTAISPYPEGKDNTVRINCFNKRRFLKTILIPDMTYIANTCSGTLAHINKGKHIKNPSVACIADTASDCFVNANTECTWVGDCNFAEFFVNYNAAPSVKISMDQGVCQTFPQGFMDGCIIYPQ